MMKALRYLKPFWLSVVLIVLMVFGQAQCELALPDHMADIVTNGIQYGGITSPEPTVLRTSTYTTMSQLSEDPTELTSCYEKIETGDPAYVQKYPLLQEEDLYIKKEGTTLSEDLKKTFLSAEMLEAPEMLNNMNLNSVEELNAALEAQPQMIEMIRSKIAEQMQDYTSDNLRAAEIMMVKQEYMAIGMDTAKMQSDYIAHAGLLMLGIAALGAAFAICSSYLASRAATGACRNMRNDVFKRVETFSSAEFDSFSTASLITRTTNDIQQVQQVLTMMLRIVLFAPFMGFTALFKVFRYGSMVGIIGWAIALILALLLITFAITLPKFKAVQKMVDRLNLVTREQLSGMLVIRAFNNQKPEEEKFDGVNRDLTGLNIFVNRVMATISPAMQFLMSGTSILIIWFGARAIDLGTLSIGDMMAFLQYAMQVMISFMIIAMIFIMIPRSSVSAKRIFEVLETKPTIKDPKEPKHLPKENSTIVFNNVSFAYPGAEEPVLKDISFTVEPGKTVAFIGSTGSGKSTLLNLLPRFFDVTKGSITFGGVDIRDVKQSELRARIGYIPQKATLFSGTIRSNLKYADENAGEELLQEALTIAQAKEFVDQMPEGIDEPIAQGGTNVSGGQKQRLSIARALVKKAQVLIFDDTFSALDYRTDASLRQALSAMVKREHTSVLIVAQRVSSIMHADTIIVLDQGRIVGMGTHDELMQNCDVYQEIAHSQLSRKELEE